MLYYSYWRHLFIQHFTYIHIVCIRNNQFFIRASYLYKDMGFSWYKKYIEEDWCLGINIVALRKLDNNATIFLCIIFFFFFSYFLMYWIDMPTQFYMLYIPSKIIIFPFLIYFYLFYVYGLAAPANIKYKKFYIHSFNMIPTVYISIY